MVELPFGTTDVPREIIATQIDIEKVEHQLGNGDVSQPAARLEGFLSDAPTLLEWLDEHGRQYPWRYTTDPWKVYASEILLQRTRGDAVAAIYEQFFDRYPEPHALQVAPDDEIKATIESLGFGNQRTRTLNECAAMIVEDNGGEVPADLELLKQPWRVGDYSARATRLFAFGESEPLVDANIARIVGRFFGYSMPSQPHKSSEVYDLLAALTPRDSGVARALYLSFLDLGAKVCTSEEPDCRSCPLAVSCQYWDSADPVD